MNVIIINQLIKNLNGCILHLSRGIEIKRSKIGTPSGCCVHDCSTVTKSIQDCEGCIETFVCNVDL